METSRSVSRVDRRGFLRHAAAGGLLVAGLGRPRIALGQAQFTDWGWPLPYEQIAAKSRQWLQDKGWWPLSAGFIVMWSGEDLIGTILMSERLLEKRGLEMKWQTFVAAGFSNEAFIPGRLQLASTGALGVLALLANAVPTRAVAVHSPGITHEALVPLDSPLRSLADLKDQKVLKRAAVVGTTTGSTNHFGFIAAAHHLGLKENQDYTLRSLPPGELASMPKGLDATTIWEPHVSNSVEILKTARRLESLNPYYLYSGYYYTRREIEENAPDVVQALTDAFVEAILWGKAKHDQALGALLALPPYASVNKALITRMSDPYFFWPKPTVYYPFDDPNGVWPKEEARISKWAYETGAARREVTVANWQDVRRTSYMKTTFEKLGWAIPERPPFLPGDWGGVGNLPYKPYAADLLKGPAPFPEPGELKKPWTFMGKTYRP
jgi:ABC-type nitrate/sulfonate/bicarbonate transport system substrate-binding protein